METACGTTSDDSPAHALSGCQRDELAALMKWERVIESGLNSAGAGKLDEGVRGRSTSRRLHQRKRRAAHDEGALKLKKSITVHASEPCVSRPTWRTPRSKPVESRVQIPQREQGSFPQNPRSGPGSRPERISHRAGGRRFLEVNGSPTPVEALTSRKLPQRRNAAAPQRRNAGAPTAPPMSTSSRCRCTAAATAAASTPRASAPATPPGTRRRARTAA